MAGKKGFCGLGTSASLARILPHFGEEPPICGQGGVAAFFFSGCTLRCAFCQNWQISRFAKSGENKSPKELAAEMLSLQEAGCSHLDFVSPTPHLPWWLEALALAREGGCRLPAVVNTNGYLPLPTLALYHQACEIILFDVKFVEESSARELCRAADYPEVAKAAARDASRRFGPLQVAQNGMATEGMILRHLVLPGSLAETEAVLRFVSSLPTPRPTISLMAQYHPSGGKESELAPPLQKALSQEDYFSAIELAGRLGFDDLIFQEPGCGEVFLPDFNKEEPFTS